MREPVARARGLEGDIEAAIPAGRVALVGAGAFGRFCIDAYRKTDDLAVVAVADSNPDALRQVDASNVHLELDWRAVVEDAAVEVVHVATPPYLRGEIVFAALAAGKSVFCEKPLALSLLDADAMIEAAQKNGVALGVNYVMRHQPAYRLLELIAASDPFGRLQTISFQNFAQTVPADHWFWDQRRSGGIFVEHGVHFFDAYGRIAGPAAQVSGSMPRPEAVEARVLHTAGVTARYYHEFAFPHEVERTVGTSFFEAGYIEIEGWIPTRLTGAALVSELALRDLGGIAASLACVQDGDVCRFQIEFPDREGAYQAAIVAGMRDLVQRHRDILFRMTVPIEDARASLQLGLVCQEAAMTGRTLESVQG